jgi:hypothetical protein
MDLKLLDNEFLGDTKMILHPDEHYNPIEAWKLVRTELIERL